MSTLTHTNRRVISSVCRQSRKIHNSMANQAAILSPSPLNKQELQEISLQPVFDIFDAPTKLSESNDFIREKYAGRLTTKTNDIIWASPPHSSYPFTPQQPLSPPSPLPLPIIFDGPARPKNEALAFQRMLRDAGLSPKPTRQRAPSSSRPFSSSEPLVQLFDGPARLKRYHHQSNSENFNSSRMFISLGVAGAIACVAVTKENETS